MNNQSKGNWKNQILQNNTTSPSLIFCNIQVSNTILTKKATPMIRITYFIDEYHLLVCNPK